MLWLGPNRKLPQIPSATNDAAGRRSTRRPEAEQRLEGGHRGLAPIVTENKFVEIDLQLMAPHSVVGPNKPLLQVPDRAMDGWQDRRSARPDLLHHCHMAIACRPKAFKRLESVCGNRCAGQDVPFGERREGVLAEIRNHLHADAPRPGPSFLHSDCDQNRFASLELTAAAQPGLRPTHPRVVELDIAIQRFACSIHHGASELVEQQPSGLVPTEGQLALKQQGGNPALVGRHQVGCPKPDRQRQLGPMQDGARSQGNLISALGTFAPLPVAERERAPVITAWTSKPLGPPTGLEVLAAGLLVREPSLKLAEACRERRPRHRGTLLIAVT